MSDYILQHDFVSLILKRLPVKTLLQCRCVCKSWKQLIASESFILDHLTLQNHQFILLQNDSLRTHLLDPHTLPLFHTLIDPITLKRKDRTRFGFTLTSVNGVNCVYNNADILLLYNPSIRKLLRIPLPDLPIFRNSDDVNYCGFWIDPCNNEFKVVMFCLEEQDAVLYSSMEKTWVEVSMAEIGDLESQVPSPQVTVDGVGHWITYAEGVYEHGGIVSFDFEKHEFEVIKTPSKIKSFSNASLCKWQDSLSVVCHDKVFGSVCNLWVMRNGSWCNMFRFRLPQDASYVFCVLERPGKVLALNDRNRLVVADNKNGVVRLKIKFKAICSYTFSYDFVESFVFPRDDCISSY